jgi:hypothetical protein
MATLDDLKSPWNARVKPGNLSQRQVHEELAEFRRDVRWRDVWMVLPLVAITAGSLFFNVWARDGVSMPTLLANGALVAFTIVVIGALWRARQGGGNEDRTLRVQLDGEITRVSRQAMLLRNVGRWFLAPMVVVEVVASLAGLYDRTGGLQPTGPMWTLYAATSVLATVTYGLCRREANRRLQPLLASLQALRQDLLADPASPGTPAEKS